jgi:DNA-3-methyladenine glycosylase
MALKKAKKLARSFYERPTLKIGPDLIGKYIVFRSPDGKLSARIVEVEAYVGQEDPACHAARGQTPRNRVMFGPGGFSYIYFIYGMYNCLNFVTELEGKPAALLLRAAEPSQGLDMMRQNSPRKKDIDLLSGPGKFCRSFGLTRKQNGLDLTGNVLWIEDRHETPANVVRTKRIGINVGVDLPWRFYDADSKAVSVLDKEAETIVRTAGT